VLRRLRPCPDESQRPLRSSRAQCPYCPTPASPDKRTSEAAAIVGVSSGLPGTARVVWRRRGGLRLPVRQPARLAGHAARSVEAAAWGKAFGGSERPMAEQADAGVPGGLVRRWPAGQVIVWADEMRVGLIGQLRRRWLPRGVKLRQTCGGIWSLQADCGGGRRSRFSRCSNGSGPKVSKPPQVIRL
jgi:hypothetical protein